MRDGSASAREAAAARLPELLKAVIRARRTPFGMERSTTAPVVGLAVGGCLGRAVLLTVFLFVIFATMISLVGGSLLQLFADYYFYS